MALVTLAVGRLQQAAATIAEQTGESVDFGTITLRIADKLVAPNTDAGRQLVQADAVAAVAATLGLTDPQVSIGTLDPRDPITLVVSAPGVVAAG